MAKATDCREMLDIYGPVIKSTATSFEYTVPSLGEFQARFMRIHSAYPWLVCQWDEQVAGYAYSGPHRTREAYQWSVELSVYVSPPFYRRGIASALYSSLISLLSLQGYYTGLAGISLPNDKSVKFHEAIGFTPVGIYSNVGYKFGEWHSVGWWELALNSYSREPKELLSIEEMSQSTTCQDILSDSENMIKSS